MASEPAVGCQQFFRRPVCRTDSGTAANDRRHAVRIAAQHVRMFCRQSWLAPLYRRYLARAAVPRKMNSDNMFVPRYWKRAARELSERDAVLRKIIQATPGLTLRSHGDAFHTLARSIVGQQISVKAANSIWQKFNASVHTITPHRVHKHNVDRLRTCGLSHSKITYLQDLALHFLEKKLVPEKWNEMSDDQLIIELTKVKGIGRWTAEM